MKNQAWHEGMTDKESKDLAYWERNMLALRFADGWYNDDVIVDSDDLSLLGKEMRPTSEPGKVKIARFEGWRRVLSLGNGKMNFHIPDDFDVGRLPAIAPRYDGHTTLEKWQRVADTFGIKFDG